MVMLKEILLRTKRIGNQTLKQFLEDLWLCVKIPEERSSNNLLHGLKQIGVQDLRGTIQVLQVYQKHPASSSSNVGTSLLDDLQTVHMQRILAALTDCQELKDAGTFFAFCLVLGGSRFEEMAQQLELQR